MSPTVDPVLVKRQALWASTWGGYAPQVTSVGAGVALITAAGTTEGDAGTMTAPGCGGCDRVPAARQAVVARKPT
jgi:hypothetical protein